MELREEKRNLFTVEDDYYLAHCISADCAMGKGIAVEFEKRFNLRDNLLEYAKEEREHPTCILEGKVFNLITKEKYWHKPTYATLEGSLIAMKNIVENEGIKKIAMPRIGSGLDKLRWDVVIGLIEKTFEDLDVEILICYL